MAERKKCRRRLFAAGVISRAGRQSPDPATGDPARGGPVSTLNVPGGVTLGGSSGLCGGAR